MGLVCWYVASHRALSRIFFAHWPSEVTYRQALDRRRGFHRFHGTCVSSHARGRDGTGVEYGHHGDSHTPIGTSRALVVITCCELPFTVPRVRKRQPTQKLTIESGESVRPAEPSSPVEMMTREPLELIGPK